MVGPKMASSYMQGASNLTDSMGACTYGPVDNLNSFVLLMAIYGGVILFSIFALTGVKRKAFIRRTRSSGTISVESNTP